MYTCRLGLHVYILVLPCTFVNVCSICTYDNFIYLHETNTHVQIGEHFTHVQLDMTTIYKQTKHIFTLTNNIMFDLLVFTVRMNRYEY
jgi:hypothetical protein